MTSQFVTVVLMPLFMLLLTAVGAWIVRAIRDIGAKIDQARISEARYQERVDRLHQGQELLSKIVSNLRTNVERHDYELRDIRDLRSKVTRCQGDD